MAENAGKGFHLVCPKCGKDPAVERINAAFEQTCRTCGSEIVETVNGSNFNEGECGPCEYAQYKRGSLVPYLVKIEVLARMIRSLCLRRAEMTRKLARQEISKAEWAEDGVKFGEILDQREADLDALLFPEASHGNQA